MTKQVTYEERVCFFIDILGFKSIVQGQNKKSAQEISNILNIIKGSQFFYQQKKLEFATKEVTHFSDSLVISFNYKESDEIYLIIDSIMALQKFLLQNYNVLLRGACTIGKLVHNKEMVFGEALNKAYELETKCSIFPRIILLEDTIIKCAKHSKIPDKEGNIKRDFLKQDSDGYWYINYLINDKRYHQLFDEAHYDSKFFDTSNHYNEYLQFVKKLIDENMNTNNLSVNQKYLWLQDKYKKAINEANIND